MTRGVGFDADVLIYAATEGHVLGIPVLRLLEDPSLRRVGSLLLLTEVLAKPMRDDAESAETAALLGILARLDLRPVDEATARLALSLAITYRLRAADAAHLATAVASGCDVFVTNNRKDFTPTIGEIDIVYPDQI